MTTFTIDHISDAHNAGIAREHDLCHYMGIKRTVHDHIDYRTSSDICVDNHHISVKASGFTLMSGNLCEGEETFEGIWNVYKRNTHSNEFAYVTKDYTVYMMNMDEFEQFVKIFCTVARDSKKNGGKTKIRCRKETSKMLTWFFMKTA